MAGATITPEAVVVDPQGRVLYRGRIDDRYVSLGLERPVATRRDLDEALTDITVGKPPLAGQHAGGRLLHRGLRSITPFVVRSSADERSNVVDSARTSNDYTSDFKSSAACPRPTNPEMSHAAAARSSGRSATARPSGRTTRQTPDLELVAHRCCPRSVSQCQPVRDEGRQDDCPDSFSYAEAEEQLEHRMIAPAPPPVRSRRRY
jgi:hypothetical protein